MLVTTANSLTERVSASEILDLHRSFPRINTTPLLFNDEFDFLIVLDAFDKLLHIIALLETVYKEALSQIASKHCAIEVVETKSDFLHLVEAGYYLCGQIFRGFPMDYIVSLSWQKKMAHQSGLKAPCEPPGHGRRCSQSDSGGVVLKTDCTSITPSEVSGPSMVDLQLIDKSHPTPSKNPGDANWSSKGPITWSILYQIEIRQKFQGFATSAAAFVNYAAKAAKAASSIEWIQSAWTWLVMSLEPDLQPGMTRIRWKCVSMNLVPERAFEDSNANTLLHSALWESPIR